MKTPLILCTRGELAKFHKPNGLLKGHIRHLGQGISFDYRRLTLYDCSSLDLFKLRYCGLLLSQYLTLSYNLMP